MASDEAVVDEARDNKMPMDAEAIAIQKRTVYLQVTPMTIAPLKGKDFKIEPLTTEMKVADKTFAEPQ